MNKVVVRKEEDSKYLIRVSKYTYEGFICRVYKIYWIFPIKVYEKIFLRRLYNNANYMMDETLDEYESTKLVYD